MKRQNKSPRSYSMQTAVWKEPGAYWRHSYLPISKPVTGEPISLGDTSRNKGLTGTISLTCINTQPPAGIHSTSIHYLTCKHQLCAPSSWASQIPRYCRYFISEDLQNPCHPITPNYAHWGASVPVAASYFQWRMHEAWKNCAPIPCGLYRVARTGSSIICRSISHQGKDKNTT